MKMITNAKADPSVRGGVGVCFFMEGPEKARMCVCVCAHFVTVVLLLR